jgi:hypothetical protein
LTISRPRRVAPAPNRRLTPGSGIGEPLDSTVLARRGLRCAAALSPASTRATVPTLPCAAWRGGNARLRADCHCCEAAHTKVGGPAGTSRSETGASTLGTAKKNARAEDPGDS